MGIQHVADLHRARRPNERVHRGHRGRSEPARGTHPGEGDRCEQRLVLRAPSSSCVPDSTTHPSLKTFPVRDRTVAAVGSSTKIITASMYLPACSHGATRTKHDLTCPSSSARFPAASPAPMLAAAAAFGFVVIHKRIIARRLPHVEPGPPPRSARSNPYFFIPSEPADISNFSRLSRLSF